MKKIYFINNLLLSIASIFVLVLVLASSLYAQNETVLQKVQNLNTPYSVNKIKVYYSPGYEKRALELRGMIEDAMKFYERKLKVREEVNLAVLTPEQWKQVGLQVPYGVPNASRNIVILPALTDNATTEATLKLKAGTSAATLEKVKASGFTFEDGATKSVDLLGLHELGHLYTLTYGINPANKWLSEFLATYFAYSYLSQKHPKLARLWEAMSDAYIDGIQPKYNSLSDFERLYFGVGLDNYGWYQAKFLLKGAQIYKENKLKFLSEVRKAFPQSEKEPIPLEVALERLEKLSPGFITWSKDLK